MTWFRRSYVADWCIVVAFIIGGYLLDKSYFYFCQPYTTSDPTIAYPLVPNTIKPSMLFLMGITPLCFFFSIHVMGWTCTHELHNTFLGYGEALGMTYGIVTALKMYVGRLRPDFLDRLRQSGYTPEQMDNWVAMCYIYDDVVMEGRKSFPSGASSVTFAAATFTTLYIIGKWRVVERGQLVGLALGFVPVVFAMFVCASRLRDFWHHGSDVVAGGLLGMVFASLAYTLNFEKRAVDDAAVPRRRGPIGYDDVIHQYHTTYYGSGAVED
eukprot:PhM_4_TR6983/c0_g1_i1/m.100009/K18693/DPP1, DPPL, PLPP4_5; diacylglycerol diphosphate phosphatase / phosphatidate phosphatase